MHGGQVGPVRGVVLHGIVGVLVDSYLTVTEAFENDIDAMEAIAFEPRQHSDGTAVSVLRDHDGLLPPEGGPATPEAGSSATELPI